jgi:hypothetical protein
MSSILSTEGEILAAINSALVKINATREKVRGIEKARGLIKRKGAR